MQDAQVTKSLLHSTIMLSVLENVAKRDIGGHALNNHGNYIVDREKSWKNHGIVLLNFCGNLVIAPDKDWKQLGIYPPLFGLIGYFKF